MLLGVLAEDKKLVDVDHNWTLTATHHLGHLYFDQGKLDEAEEIFLRVLAGYEKVVGNTHPWTIETVANLAQLYTRLGRLEEAEKLFLRALDTCETASRTDSLTALYTIYHMGLLYRRQEKEEEAQKMLQRALEGCRKVFGPKHSHTREVADALSPVSRFDLENHNATMVDDDSVEDERNTIGMAT